MSAALDKVKDRIAAKVKAGHEPVGRLERTIQKVPYITGFCGNGAHEGAIKFTHNGARLRSCSGDYTIQGKLYRCRCDCHDAFRQIAEITGLTTQSTGSFDLIGQMFSPSSFIDVDPLGGIPTQREGEPLADTTEAKASPSDPPTPPVPFIPAQPSGFRMFSPVSVPEFKPTKTGQRARGQLEAQVAKVTLQWFKNQDSSSPRPMKPDECAMLVNPSSPPSSGAVYAIFKRWETQAYCKLGSKPFRMTELTEQGLRSLSRWE